jgi:hypothetical protein
MKDDAIKWAKKGFSVIPLKEDKTPNVKSWVEFQKKAITDFDSFDWSNGIGLVCGEISGNILVIDVDSKYDLTGTLYSELIELIETSKEGILDRMQIHSTRKGGFHLIFACESQPIGNKKLASRPANEEERAVGDKVKVLLETRGEGGYICLPPMDGYKIQKEGFGTLTDDEVDIILSCCRSFNQMQEKEPSYQKKSTDTDFIINPFEDYNRKGDCVAELKNHGWTVVFEKGGKVYLKRPGTTDSRQSGNFSVEHNKFFVFSSSTEFTENTAYSPVAVFCKLNHNDDWKACAKDLVSKGYGQKRQPISKKYSSAINKLRKQEFEDDDIVVELRKIDGKPIDEVQEILSSYKSNQGKQVSTFWNVDINDKGEPKIKISYYDFCRFINDRLNIFRYKLQGDDQGFRYIQINNGRVRQITMSEIKDLTKDYLESLEFVFDGIYRSQLMEVLYRSASSLFSDNMMEFLEYADIDILRSTSKEAYFPFKNCIVKVSKHNKIEKIGYEDIEGKLIWESSVINHSIELDFDFEKFSFHRFLEKINGDDVNRLNYCFQLIGYCLHDYKDPLVPVSVVFGEETADSKQGGGAGKGILTNAISRMIKTTTIDGKSFNPDREFAFQRVGVDTKVILLQDTSDKFDMESLFSKTTDGFTIRKMFTPEIFVPYEFSPKFIITTNYSIDNDSSASDRRLKLLEFSSFFNNKNKPIDYLGEVLFNSWDKEKWDKFYTLMFSCVLNYIENGIQEMTESHTSKIKRIATKYGEDFHDWFKDYSMDSDIMDFQDIYQSFLVSCGYNDKSYSLKRFNYALKYAIECYQFEHSTIQDPITRRKKMGWVNTLKPLKETNDIDSLDQITETVPF